MWEPITGAEIAPLVNRNASNGVELEQIWWRANLYSQTRDFMVALRNVVRAQPDNSVALAFYAKAALEWRGVIASENAQKVPEDIDTNFGLSIAAIRLFLDKAQQSNSRNWVAFLTEPDIKRYTGGRFPPSLEEVAYTRQALHISDNPWTNVAFANALVSWAIEHPKENDSAQSQRAVAILERSKRRFPNYPRTDVALFQYYAYYPLTKNPEKAQQAEKRLMNSIRPALRQTAPIQRYLDSIHLDRQQ